MAHSLSDSDDSIPEIELSINIQPYMHEPKKRDFVPETDSSDSSSSSESDGDPSEDDPLPDNTNEWCTCGSCRQMPSSRENKCCQSTNIVDGYIEAADLKCITDHESFQVNCLNRHVLEICFYEYLEEAGPLPNNERIHRVYRHLAYRRFVRWIWKRLGKGNRRILPSCVVNKIRRTFPSQEYCGFQYPTDYS